MDYKFLIILERYQLSVRNGMPERDAYTKAYDELRDARILDRIGEFRHHIRGPRTYFAPERPPSALLREWQKPADTVTTEVLARYDSNYGSVRHGGQQWSIPECVFEKLGEMGSVFEVFASPMNRSRHAQKWGSMFEDDKAFGSVGPFQSQPLTAFEGMVVVLNPPYIEFMIEMMLKRLPEIRRVAKAVLICLPAWSDTVWYAELSRSTFRFDLNANTYTYWNSLKNEPICARFDSVLFADTRQTLDAATRPWLHHAHTYLLVKNDPVQLATVQQQRTVVAPESPQQQEQPHQQPKDTRSLSPWERQHRTIDLRPQRPIGRGTGAGTATSSSTLASKNRFALLDPTDEKKDDTDEHTEPTTEQTTSCPS